MPPPCFSALLPLKGLLFDYQQDCKAGQVAAASLLQRLPQQILLGFWRSDLANLRYSRFRLQGIVNVGVADTTRSSKPHEVDAKDSLNPKSPEWPHLVLGFLRGTEFSKVSALLFRNPTYPIIPSLLFRASQNPRPGRRPRVQRG